MSDARTQFNYTQFSFFFFFPPFPPQTEISKRLNAIITQIVPFLSQEHQQQVLTAVERAKQITMSELNAVIGVSPTSLLFPE